MKDQTQARWFLKGPEKHIHEILPAKIFMEKSNTIWVRLKACGIAAVAQPNECCNGTL